MGTAETVVGALVTYRYYARLTPGDQVPSVWCGDFDGPNVYKLCEHRWMVAARLHAAWRNWRRPTTSPIYDIRLYGHRPPDRKPFADCATSETPRIGGQRRDTCPPLFRLRLPRRTHVTDSNFLEATAQAVASSGGKS